MQKCAQVLLTQDNLSQRGQYDNAHNTFTELFHYRSIPVVNENDTVAVEHLRFGDNDTLSAQVRCRKKAKKGGADCQPSFAYIVMLWQCCSWQ